jgi:hypothetical protein
VFGGSASLGRLRYAGMQIVKILKVNRAVALVDKAFIAINELAIFMLPRALASIRNKRCLDENG